MEYKKTEASGTGNISNPWPKQTTYRIASWGERPKISKVSSKWTSTNYNQIFNNPTPVLLNTQEVLVIKSKLDHIINHISKQLKSSGIK